MYLRIRFAKIRADADVNDIVLWRPAMKARTQRSAKRSELFAFVEVLAVLMVAMLAKFGAASPLLHLAH